VSFETPVAFLVFNRPEQTARVFAEIAKLRPRTLLVVADGPRGTRPGEADLCARVREIVEAVDWECTVHREYSESNLGCRLRVSSGLDWVFSRVEEAIVLEDDCLPDPTFFRFCGELLERYRDDERVMMVSGDAFHPYRPGPRDSYRFSRFNFIWGWASWRRAWAHYDPAISLWPELRETDWLREITGDPVSAEYWRGIFERVHRGEIDTWDYQWIFASWTQNGLAITPANNLVSNIGFGEGATHTVGASRLAELPTFPMEFPLRHPRVIARDLAADHLAGEAVFGVSPHARPRPLHERLRSGAARVLPQGVRRLLRSVAPRGSREG
jgi:hypothetical protein